METAQVHPMATGHIPWYLPGPDGSDPMFTFMAAFTILLIILIGGLYFRLHALPEQMAHTGNHTQFQVVGILALLALFTHNNIFWVAALLLAAFRMPDFLTPIQSIADSLKLQSIAPQPLRTEHVAVQFDSHGAELDVENVVTDAVPPKHPEPPRPHEKPTLVTPEPQDGKEG